MMKDSQMFNTVLESVLSDQECLELIKISEEQGYVPSSITKSDGTEVMDVDHRDSGRVIIDDYSFAKKIFERVKAFLPQCYHQQELKGINERFRYLRYEPGQRFTMHSDGSYERSDGSELSLMTIMIYLNGHDDLRGGETILYNEDGEPESIIPKAGRILIFDHDIYHEGARVENGTKYCIRSDIMYTND